MGREERAEAGQQNRRVAVFVTGPAEARKTYPGIFEQLEDPARFEEKALVKGIEAFWSIQVFEQVVPSPPTAMNGPRSNLGAPPIGPGSGRSGAVP